MIMNDSDKWQVTGDPMAVDPAPFSRQPSPVTRHASRGAECRVSSVENDANAGFRISGSGLSSLVSRQAFTLIEVLVVIAIIAALAALILPVAGAVKRHAYIQTAQSEMAQVQTALERYHSAYGFYPPGCRFGPVVNQLYFELTGTTNKGSEFVTLDNSAQISPADATSWFGASGFMNCSKSGGDESAPHAQNFLPDLKPTQIVAWKTNGVDVANLLVVSVGGPDQTFMPLGANYPGVNPWRYAYPGTHNPGSYDLWVQLDISGTTNLICNWNRQVLINDRSQ